MQFLKIRIGAFGTPELGSFQQRFRPREAYTFTGCLQYKFITNNVIGFSDLFDLWVIKIKKAHDPLRT